MAAASTGVIAAALGGTTVHSAFRISNNSNAGGLKTETLNQFRAAFTDILWAVYIDECSIIGEKIALSNRFAYEANLSSIRRTFRQ